MSQFETPEPHLQITFYHRLMEVRETHLLNALLSKARISREGITLYERH